jgi:nicotinate-nucleotide adenylyltransferase
LNNLPEIGLFCGTFNPIHNAHLLLAQCACDQFKLHKIYFVTSPRPPHRQDVTLPGEARQEMVLQAVSDNDKFIASEIELERAGPSYTIDTIQYFKGDFNVNLLVGADNIIHLPTWHKFDEIVQSCKLLIAPRRMDKNRVSSGDQKTAIFTMEEHIVLSKIKYDLIDSPLVDIASSDIRQRVKQEKTVRYMVPEKVWQIIEKEKYFK